MGNSILWITPKWPIPAHDGARIATCQLVKHSTHLGAKIDLVAVVDAHEEVDSTAAIQQLGVRETAILRKSRWDSGKAQSLRILSSLIFSPEHPVTLRSFVHSKVQKDFKAVLKQWDRQWDAIVFDGMHTAGLTSNGKTFSRPFGNTRVIYRAHNVESQLWVQAAKNTKSALKQWMLKKQAHNVARFEKSLILNSDSIASVSSEDLHKFRGETPDLTGESIPIGMDIPTQRPHPPQSKGINQLLFLGRLDWPPNKEGLQWFLKNIGPLFLVETRT